MYCSFSLNPALNLKGLVSDSEIMRPAVHRCFVCGCETWSHTLREERRLRMFENRLLRRIFGRKMDELTGEWRKLHNEELNP
jgi:hypothetical protein